MKQYLFPIFAVLVVGALMILYLAPFTPLEEKIAVSVNSKDSGCEQDFPVGLTLTNRSRSTVTDTAVEVIVREVGYSRDLERQRFDTDKVIKPGESFSMCVVQPRTNPVLVGQDLPPSVYTDTYAKFPESSLEYSAEVLVASSD